MRISTPEEEDENARIPSGIAEGQPQRLVRLIPEQHFTQPPPRYSEASLVRTLEEYGIGRPSTYAPILGHHPAARLRSAGGQAPDTHRDRHPGQ